jgi:hypothetical protein
MLQTEIDAAHLDFHFAARMGGIADLSHAVKCYQEREALRH